MRVKKAQTAGDAAATVRSPPAERASVRGLAAYALLNKPMSTGVQVICLYSRSGVGGIIMPKELYNRE